MRADIFGVNFYKICDAAGITKAAHGLRKLAAKRAAEGRATNQQFKRHSDWTNDRQTSRYSWKANKKILAQEMAKYMRQSASF
ncbi:MAG: site-specific integrase [Candidatus Tokpelaia sp.]|nr:MAG: site-specific integrase [Candidatus Tokpelaia sp.]KAA6207345.1 MAG: site-specific integrase [Candidatus Tokpelaia sp.]